MKKEFITNRQGKEFCLFAGLLDQAHQEGLKRITTKLLQPPLPENGGIAICWAEVETDKGVFCGIGDADDHNVGKMIVAHKIRMAETRAKGRALRDAINVAMVSVEELGGDDDAPTQRPAPQSTRQEPTPIRRTSGPKDGDPAPADWRQKLLDLAEELHALNGTETITPERLLVGEARNRKARLIAAIEQATKVKAAGGK